MTASSKNISKKSPSRKSRRVSRGRPRLTSKYCCIIGVSFCSVDIGSGKTHAKARRRKGKTARRPLVWLGGPAGLREIKPMLLFHRDLGGAGHPSLVVLHGMLGSSRNWQTAGRELAARYHVLAPDLRNHG